MIEGELVAKVSSLSLDFNDEDLRELKTLNGVINEGLRLRPPVGQGLASRCTVERGRIRRICCP